MINLSLGSNVKKTIININEFLHKLNYDIKSCNMVKWFYSSFALKLRNFWYLTRQEKYNTMQKN